ncbi:biotin synthase BioB [candidate division WOR-1 bacterium RIFOXYA12_FULL_52_29]|uniref:Biotin synthase n=1 Tax=candidate division WOR-1 bacterium RIFOXYC12_FULL_54_18 TaxID=1802584 RepID=A0A1F4T7D6_UNCSA|nr:MAG: biotin synthase BioB [candidate division WOR-1 bacterium RIFOXYA2_FULL_51_19]OGC18284.1 MAG: biotin synthase BioB [candidate division WOR-1 bacterium RIFOXYA12_FULL_52_29]OGC27139.1 MAG: biotin synthase BioB [candidate division WOR-1 bacterium RIFOXYB2_FULL_45_9]OGC28701.1 MAG: biotin synthase BioB [candidate division WOR-1 bacterium RIFOXYC12_FULL_54_18]OGC30844.1 MAG: biotin synthase BioB [candidate division WOR-1 bacterium RIFOXYB12_FULL_52_16]
MDHQSLANRLIGGEKLAIAEALELISTPDEQTFELLAAANHLRRRFKGNKVRLCSIVNAKSGHCSENCSFCAQSGHYQTNAEVYPLLPAEEIAATAKKAEEEQQATCFSIVTSGRGVNTEKDIAEISGALKMINDTTKMNRCASLGILDRPTIRQLKAAGLKKLHHNLEAAESFFSNVCTTHTFAERVETIKNAKAEGVAVCAGGIFNLGESLKQRVELAMALRELDVDSVPINILNPVAGTPAAAKHRLISPLEVLRLIATYRFIMPTKDIGLFGGREQSLGQLQPLMFIAGANVTLVGNYLTTSGQSAEQDLAMIKALGLEIEKTTC